MTDDEAYVREVCELGIRLLADVPVTGSVSPVSENERIDPSYNRRLVPGVLPRHKPGNEPHQWKCPSCGITQSEPPTVVARRLGFDQELHCVMLANRIGKVVPCWGLRVLRKRPCNWECLYVQKFCEEKIIRGTTRWYWRGE